MERTDNRKSGYSKSGLLPEIYEQVISEGQDAKKAGDRIGQYVKTITSDAMKTKDNEDVEEWEGFIYSATERALQEGFYLGARFAFMLFLELVSGVPGE